MIRTTFIAALLLASTAAHAVDSDGTAPDHSLTPGGVRTMERDEICDPTRRTKDVRNVPGSLKEQAFKLYGLSSKRDGWCNSEEGCEVDHLISLELGGSNEIENLWPQSYSGDWNAHDKDRLEGELHKRICSGRMEVRETQTAIARDWKIEYVRVFGSVPTKAD